MTGHNALNALPNNKVCDPPRAAGLSSIGLQIALHATRSPIALVVGGSIEVGVVLDLFLDNLADHVAGSDCDALCVMDV